MRTTLFLLCAAALAAGCRSASPLAGSAAAEAPATATAAAAEATAYVQKAASLQASSRFLTADAKVSLTGFGKDLTVQGSLRMRRDDVVRLSLRFLGMEVGLLELTPQDVLVVDRIHKQYVRAPYAEVSFLRQAGLDFHSLQALFWDELFVPGSPSALPHASRFTLSSADGQRVLTLTGAPALTYRFHTSPADAVVRSLTVKGSGPADKGAFSCTYGGYTVFGARPFPTTMSLRVTGTGRDAGLDLTLSSLRDDAGWNPRTAVSDKYRRRTLSEVLKSLGAP